MIEVVKKLNKDVKEQTAVSRIYILPEFGIGGRYLLEIERVLFVDCMEKIVIVI